jgi:twitching motility protein PilT
MAKLDELLKLMVKQNASDLHLSSGSVPYFRIHGHMVELNSGELKNDYCQKLLFEILSEKQIDEYRKRKDLDCSYFLPGTGRFRLNIFTQLRGMAAVFRSIPEKVRTLQELGMPESIYDLADNNRGLILVTGPTGSGKSTTLASMVDHINTTRKEHIITIEDPIEFVHKNKKCLINQREASTHTESFAAALRAALREDPDVILVGEMRDLETVSLALTAAETGHLVFGTLHTNSAAKTIDRIIDSYPSEQQAQIRVMLSESLLGVVAQTLLPRHDQPGMVAAVEILKNTAAVRSMIREAKTFQISSVLQTGMSQGMIPFEKSIKDLLDEAKISPATAANALQTKV